MCRRVHIGNISPKLKENGALLSSRLAKYGIIKNPLEFHTKALGDYYFAYVDIELSDKEFERLKATLNGMLYMGRKISISAAKSLYMEAWKKDHGRPSVASKVLENKAGIAHTRG
ncbi:hypothetical protein HF325_003266 [Metschnikowia pulcherrima]|uniref:Uncharacterized protein n=1 Tax=Metschnikowia pulcherrima TaxID=27326 RepID=A0A8H7GTW8_9ASCO|nr:hypothetical protein HF325_003266 [Metschnikowia pulcherrima]